MNAILNVWCDINLWKNEIVFQSASTDIVRKLSNLRACKLRCKDFDTQDLDTMTFWSDPFQGLESCLMESFAHLLGQLIGREKQQVLQHFPRDEINKLTE